MEPSASVSISLRVRLPLTSEINPRVNARNNYKIMLEYCEKYRTPVIINSDAHDPSAVGVFDYAIAMVKEYGFDQSLIVNTDEEKLKKFILG